MRPHSRILVSNSFLTQYKLALRMDQLSRMNMFNSQLVPVDNDSKINPARTNKKILEALIGFNLEQELKSKNDETSAIKKIKMFERLFRRNEDDGVKTKNKDDADKRDNNDKNSKKKDDKKDDDEDDGGIKRYQSEEDSDDDDGDQEELIPSC